MRLRAPQGIRLSCSKSNHPEWANHGLGPCVYKAMHSTVQGLKTGASQHQPHCHRQLLKCSRLANASSLMELVTHRQ